MALSYSSDQITNFDLRPPAFPHSADELHIARGKVTVDTSLAINNLVGLVKLPPGCVPVDIVMFLDDIDDATSFVFDVGILDEATTDLVSSSLLIDGSTVGQAAGIARMDDYECVFEPATWLAETDAPDAGDPVIVALKVMTAAGTPAAGDIYATVMYRSMLDGQ